MDIAARIRATGGDAGRADSRGRPVAKVRCQGCGEEIASDGGLAGVEYVETKRGTELFFHASCRDKVWDHGIAWEEEQK